MSPEELKALAAQLRNPEGDLGLMVGEKMNESNNFINHNTMRLLDAKPFENVLEIGMGNGHFVDTILSGHETICYSGCDTSELMIEESRKRNRHYIDNGQAEFILTDGTILPFESETFDKVMTVNTLYFWEDPKLVLDEIRRVMKPGARIFISIRPKSTLKTLAVSKYGFKLYGEEDVLKLLTDNWFTIIDEVLLDEPDQEFQGESFKVSTYIICAEK